MVIKEFLETLTDLQFITFALHFGYNDRNINLTLTEIANITGKPLTRVSEAKTTAIQKLSQLRFRPILESMNENSSD